MAKKGKNIYKRKDGRWEARFIKNYSSNGKAVYGYCYAKTYKEVCEKLENEKIKLKLSKNFVEKDLMKKIFFDYCDEWLLLHRNKIKESTFVKYSTSIEKYIKPEFGSRFPHSITSVDVEFFSNRLLHSENLSTKTVHDILSLFHAVLKYISSQVPFMPVITIYYPKVEKKEVQILNKTQQKNLADFLTDNINECNFGILLAMFTGLRIGELCALRWGDINIENKTLTVSSTVQRIKNTNEKENRKTKVILTDPKSFTSSRTIPFSNYIAELCAYVKKENPNAFVLTGREDVCMEPRSLQYKFKKYSRQCGIENVHFHLLRHTFATRCVESGFEIKSLSEVLGHSNPRITLEKYVHSSLELKRENMDKLNLF